MLQGLLVWEGKQAFHFWRMAALAVFMDLEALGLALVDLGEVE